MGRNHTVVAGPCKREPFTDRRIFGGLKCKKIRQAKMPAEPLYSSVKNKKLFHCDIKYLTQPEAVVSADSEFTGDPMTDAFGTDANALSQSLLRHLALMHERDDVVTGFLPIVTVSKILIHGLCPPFFCTFRSSKKKGGPRMGLVL